MTVFCDMLGRPALSKPSFNFYYESIKDMETSAFTRRATEIIRSRKYTNLPTPADFLDLPDAADQGMAAAETALRVMERVGADADVTAKVFGGDGSFLVALARMGGWVAACEAVNEYELDKLGIWKRDFAAVYRQSQHDQAPRVLLGRHSQGNALRGYLNIETGELRNAAGDTVRLLPWGSKAIGDGGDQKLLEDVA